MPHFLFNISQIKHFFIPVLLLSFLASNAQKGGDFSDGKLLGAISWEVQKDLLFVKPFVRQEGEKSRTITYKLEVVRTDKWENRSKNQQSGEVVVAPNIDVLLSESRVNYNKNTQVIAVLSVFENGHLLFDISETYANTKTKKKKVITSDLLDIPSSPGLEINGLIINRTRSKIGRDFYDLFYQKWQTPNNITVDYSITIEELPARGRGSRVKLLVNDDLVYMSFLQPRSAVITSAAEQAVGRVTRYLKNKQTNSGG